MDELSVSQLAGRAGVQPEDVERLVQLGILVPGEGERPFTSGDVRRVRLASACAEAGLPLEGIGAAMAARSTRSVTLCLAAFAQLAFAAGDRERAALLAGAAEGLRRRGRATDLADATAGEAELLAQLRQALEADHFDEAVAAGARLNQRAQPAGGGGRRPRPARRWHTGVLSVAVAGAQRGNYQTMCCYQSRPVLAKFRSEWH